MAESCQHGKPYPWAQLVRLPNVFTVVADVSAGFLLVARGADPVARWAVVLLAGISLYWAGMILNDVFDLEIDRKQRPTRPLVAGHICPKFAKWVGATLLVAGILLATLSGMVSPTDTAPTWLPAILGIVLAGMILAYDGPLKATPLAPAAMGMCRMLSFLLGASPALILPAAGDPFTDKYVVAIALGFGLYVMGITTMARNEAARDVAVSDWSHNLKVGLVVTMIGAGVLAFAPQTAPRAVTWYLSPWTHFPLLIGMIVYPVALRGYRCIQKPNPQRIQMTIRSGILTIIPLSAAVALLAAGPYFGLAVFALIVPAMLLGAKLPVT
ncbi:UbiA family prenyltransferase [Novipirellula artificiosorum]|uniref:Prenyltransferase n=1 Tax=Novipirellula artificiosorum TaxID=2528016 RepID=A0A5C6DIK5_9BACT|nr:UbiA family prenyltransferase [Novipirellula artificiosorum]TWU37203.1 prenyltransferase [Novipirellula artificiosorum]